MRLSLPRLTILLALGVSPTQAFTIPSSPRCIGTTFTSRTCSISNTALHAKKNKGNAAKDAALAALEALEAQEGGVATATALDFDDDEPMSKKDLMKQKKKDKGANGATNGAANGANGGAADLDALLSAFDDDAGLTKKEQMALEKRKQKEAKKVQNEEERKMKEEMEERERNKRKKALKVSLSQTFTHFVLNVITHYSTSHPFSLSGTSRNGGSRKICWNNQRIRR